MTIYSVNSEILYEAPLTEGALIKYELMGDYYIELPFDAGSYIDIPRGSYIDHEVTRYTVMENILPEPKAEGGYHYAIKFWAGQSFMKNRKLFWLKGANKESSFHITTTIDQFGQLVVDNMNEFMPDKWTLASQFPADALTVTKTISFEGDSCWDAVSSIAEAYGIEWWVRHDEDRMELYFGKLEGGNLVDFKVGEAITSIPSQKGDDSQYGTRFYVYGSNQNLPEGYGDTEQGGTVHHVSNPRLMLPSGIDYIDAKRDMTPAEIIEQVVIFEDVYPKNTDTVTAVTTVQRPIENAAEGQPQTFTAYQLIAANTPFLPSDVMEGETLRLVFNSGALTGVEFEVDLRDADDNHIDPIKWKPEDGFIKKFELIAITEQVGDTVATLPNESVHPVVGDEFVLLGVRLSDDKVREAEEELLQRGEEWKDEHSKDTSVYNCPTNPVYCKRGLLSFALGQRVRLYDPRFDGGYRDSRIQGFEKRIWNEYIATYTIGDNAAYTRIGAVESSVTNLKTTERTIGMILDELASTAKDLSDMFEMVEYNKTKMIRANYDFFSVGGVSCGGIGSSSGGTGGGGSTTLSGLNDVALKSAIANDMLVYNGTHWVNTPMSAIKPDLTAYATKLWVEGKNYITADALAPYALKTELPSLAGYATEEFVTTRGYITAAALAPYATTADITNTYATKTALEGVDIRVQAIEMIFDEDQNGVIDKWSEIITFLDGIEDDKLTNILDEFATKALLNTEIAKKADKATSFEGYGITGGTLTSQVVHYNAPFYIQRDSQPRLSFSIKNGANSNFVYFGEDENKIPKFEFTNWGWSKGYEVLHAGNIANYTVPKTGGTFRGSVKVIKDFGGNLSDFLTKQHYGAFEVGRASNNMCLAIGVTDDDYGYIQSKGKGVTNQGKLVLNPMGGSLYYSAELKPIFHEGNYTNYVYSKDQVVPKNGGEFTNAITISKDISGGGRQLILNGTSAEQVNWNAIISFRRTNEELAYIGSSAGTEGLGSLNFVVASVTSMYLNEKGLTVNSNVTAPTFIGNLQGNADRAKMLSPIQNQDEDEPLPNALPQGLRIKFKRHDKVGFSTDANGYWWTAVDVNAVGGGGTSTGKRLQLMFTNGDGNPTATDKLYARFGRDEEWRSPRELAFTDSNVASATKLQTPRSIWGRSFDGTGNVDGDVVVSGKIAIRAEGVDYTIFGDSNNASYLRGSVVSLQTGNTTILRVTAEGEVGIGTTNPAEKLDVAGNIKTSGLVRIGDAILSWDATNKCVTIKNANTGEKASLFVDGGVTGTAIN